MIIYYSATGNCKYVAKKIADKTRDIAVSMIGHDYSIYLKKGESLGLIAKRYGTTIAQLKKLNSLKSDTVHVGQVLYLP